MIKEIEYINLIHSLAGRLEKAVNAANRQIPGFYTEWLSDDLMSKAIDVVSNGSISMSADIQPVDDLNKTYEILYNTARTVVELAEPGFDGETLINDDNIKDLDQACSKVYVLLKKIKVGENG